MLLERRESLVDRDTTPDVESNGGLEERVLMLIRDQTMKPGEKERKAWGGGK